LRVDAVLRPVPEVRPEEDRVRAEALRGGEPRLRLDDVFFAAVRFAAVPFAGVRFVGEEDLRALDLRALDLRALDFRGLADRVVFLALADLRDEPDLRAGEV